MPPHSSGIGVSRRNLAYDIAGDVIGLLVRQQRGIEPDTKRHVVQGIGCGGQKPTHSGAIVEAVSSPERRKMIAEPVLQALSRAVCTMACSANLRVDFCAAVEIGGAIGVLYF